MRHLWPYIYVIGAVCVLAGGYLSLSAGQTERTNADWLFVSLAFAITCVFPLGAMAYSCGIGVQEFRRPSLDRQPLDWWRDTLQPLRVSVVSAALYLLGASFALPHADHRGVMLFWFYAALAAGLFIGERLVYRVYRAQIV